MKTKTMQFASLGMEIPPLEADKEGKLRGGFGVFNSGMEDISSAINTNCNCDCACSPDENTNCNCRCTTPTSTSTSTATSISEKNGSSLNFSSSFLF